MQLPKTLLEIAQYSDDDDPVEVNRRLEQAAGLVEDFARSAAMPALDALLANATGGGDNQPAPAIRPLADELAQQTELLEEEVKRFLAHKQQISAS